MLCTCREPLTVCTHVFVYLCAGKYVRTDVVVSTNAIDSTALDYVRLAFIEND